ncbi:MAG: VCBS repeat-containing protein [Steroidobacteraceae bacterium]|jgi:hypothetical protein|nr:VCBS repeat-containing protein [Steroidobacteraceae bacterium]
MRTRLVRALSAAAPLAAVLAVGGCGGGGGGSGGGSSIIPAFDLQVGVVAADLDGNGRLDVAVANTYVAGPPPHPGTVRVYLHEAASPRSFAAAVRYDVGADPWGIAAADLSSDGLRDLVVATPDGDRVWLLEQDGTQPGRFHAARSFSTPRAPYETAPADVDGDGRNDLAIALNSRSPGGAAVLLQEAAAPGDFGGAVHVPLGPGGTSVAAADVNADGRTDLLLASWSSDPARAGLYLALQDPVVEGSFLPAVRIEAGQRPRHVAAADLDADGRPDLVVANDGIDGKGSGMTVLLADAARPGHFRPGIFHAMDDIAHVGCVADFNNDRRPDIAVSAAVAGLVNDLESVVQLYLQDPLQPGRFVRAGRYGTGDQVLYIVAADLDGDGATDIVTDEGPRVLYNDPGRPGLFAAARPL